MNDLISRKALLKKAYLTCQGHGIYGFVVDKETIVGEPPVDAVPVVRCKDCWKREKFEEGSEGRTWALCYEVSGYVYEDDFCSNGERKDNDL